MGMIETYKTKMAKLAAITQFLNATDGDEKTIQGESVRELFDGVKNVDADWKSVAQYVTWRCDVLCCFFFWVTRGQRPNLPIGSFDVRDCAWAEFVSHVNRSSFLFFQCS